MARQIKTEKERFEKQLADAKRALFRAHDCLTGNVAYLSNGQYQKRGKALLAVCEAVSLVHTLQEEIGNNCDPYFTGVEN